MLTVALKEETMDDRHLEFYREQHEINRGFIARLDAMAIESAESRKRDVALAKDIEKLLDFVERLDGRGRGRGARAGAQGGV